MNDALKRTTGALTLTALLLIGAAGCAPEPEDAEPKATRTATPQPTETPTPEPTQPAEVSWDRFTDTRFTQSFELPPGWSARERPADADVPDLHQFDVVDGDGTERLFFSTAVTGLGGACGDEATRPTLALQELDSAPMDIPGYVQAEADPSQQLVSPHFSYRVAEYPGGVVGSLAIVDDNPPPSCFYYNLIHAADGLQVFADSLQIDTFEPPHSFASMDEATAYMNTDEYRTLKRILLSYRIDA